MDRLKNKIRVSISIDPKVWNDWKEFSKKQRMNASQLFEITAATTMGAYDGAFDIVGKITKLLKDGKQRVNKS
jgi:hypothetical protein